MQTKTLQALATLLAGACLISPNAHAQQRFHELDSLYVQAASRVPQVGQAAFRSVDVVSRSDIEQLPARTVADVLARVLGIDVTPRSDAQADLSVRGSSFEQVLVLVNGARVSDEQTGHFDLDLAVPLAMVERIEVLRGAGSAVHGSDAVGGVVNIVTSANSRTSAELQVGSFSTGFGAFTAAAGGINVGGDYARSAGHRAGTDYEIYQARASAARALRTGRLGFDVGIGVRDFGAADFYAPYASHERTTSFTSLLQFETQLGRRWLITPQLSVRQHTDRFTLKRADPTFYQNEHRSWQTALETSARYAAGDAFAAAFGAEVFAAGLESARLGDRMERRAALFAEATVGNARLAAVSAGLRTDWGNDFSMRASPSLAVALRANDALRLRASFARGFRVPTWTERYYRDPANIGDPALRPELFWTSELGVRVQATPAASLDIAAFIRQAADMIDWAKPAGAAAAEPWRTMNVEQATFKGVEARLSLPAVAGVTAGMHALALSVAAEDANGFVSKYALRQITQQLGITLEVPVSPALAATAELRNARRRLEGSFTTADVRATWTAGDFRVHFDATNVSNANYLDASAKPVAGRAFALGVGWTRRLTGARR